MKVRYALLFLFLCNAITAQNNNFIEQDLVINNFVEGTLLIPKDLENKSLAIIIGGSGPTDRNGNQNFLKNNSLKKLAVSLTNEGIATFRYDKRIVKQIHQGRIDKNIKFDDFVTDAISVVDYFKSKNKYNKIYIIGHSQGSLVGILAAKRNVDGLISIAGAGKPIDSVLIDQIEKTAPMLAEDSKRVLSIMRSGKTTDNYPKTLASIFNKDIQPFMMNWMQYNPKEEIKKLEIPTLILNGTKDLQVSPGEAKTLKEASKNGQLKIIENMNHVFFLIEGDDLENSKSYNESFREISTVLTNEIITFIKSNN